MLYSSLIYFFKFGVSFPISDHFKLSITKTIILLFLQVSFLEIFELEAVFEPNKDEDNIKVESKIL